MSAQQENSELFKPPTKQAIKNRHSQCTVTMEGRNFLVFDCPAPWGRRRKIGYETVPDADDPLVPPEFGSRAWIGRIDKTPNPPDDPRAGIKGVLNEGLENIGGLRQYIDPTDKVFIKVNLGSGIFDDLTIIEETVSHPDVTASVIEQLKEIGVAAENIAVTESDSSWVDMNSGSKALQKFGYNKMLKDTGAKFHNLTKDEWIPFKVAGEKSMIDVTFPKALLKDKHTDQKTKIITISPMKRHFTEGVTLTMKNMFGAIPEPLKVHYHQTEGGLRHIITAAARIMRPDISINDGVIGCALDHATCVPVNYKHLIISNDAVCADRHTSDLMYYPHKRSPHIQLAIDRGDGDANCDLDGDKDKMVNPTWELYDIPQELVTAGNETLAGMAGIHRVPRWVIAGYSRHMLQPAVAMLNMAIQGVTSGIYALPEMLKEDNIWQF